MTKLRCAAQHMAFSTFTGAYMGESGRYDAYETLLEVLRAKAAHPHAAPEELRRLDPRFDAFLDCRKDEEEEEEQGAGALAAKGRGKEQQEAEPDRGEDGDAVEEEAQKAKGLELVQEVRRSSRRAMRGDDSSREREDLDVGSGVGRGGAGGGRRVRASGALMTGATGAAGNVTEALMRKKPLCSVSPFDAGDSDAVMCGQLMKGLRRAYGGLMCAWSPEDMASCPRPWA